MTQKVNWLLETDIFEENDKKLVAEIKKQGHNCKVLAYEPFESGQTYLDAFPKNEPTIFYGSIGFALQVRREAEWIPGTFYTPDNYLCSNYYPILGKYHLAENYAMLPYGDLIRQKEFLFSVFGNNRCIFIRPDSGDKPFTGTVVEYDRYEKDVEMLGFYDVPDNEIVVVSEPKNIVREWRFLVCGDKLVTGSLYKEKNEKICKEFKFDSEDKRLLLSYRDWQASSIAFDVKEVYKPDRCFVVDICQLKNGDYKLLELGSFSSAGLYECDLSAVVKGVSEQAILEWEEYQCVE